MKLKNLRLTTANVARTTNSKDFECIETSVNRVRNENGSYSRDVDSYSIHCSAYKGDILKVKVPKTLANKVTELSDSLSNDVTVMITFTGLKITPYAMIGTDGKLYSGVSAKADDFTFTTTSVDFDVEI